MRREATHPPPRDGEGGGGAPAEKNGAPGESERLEEENDGDDDEGIGGGSVGGGDVQLQGDSSRADLNTLTAVSTPIPRVAMHLKKIRSPDYFRTQYLSNLGIWTKDRAKHLSSAPRTEARYKSDPG